MTKITPFLWFNNQAEEAMEFYTSIFRQSKKGEVVRNGPGGPAPEGSVLYASFDLDGQEFMALNGGPEYKFSPAVSFFVNCKTQAEVDELWEKLATDGEVMQCGWLTDKFGVTWQIVPEGLEDVLRGPDPEGSSRAIQAMMQMKKLDLDTLRRAYKGGA